MPKDVGRGELIEKVISQARKDPGGGSDENLRAAVKGVHFAVVEEMAGGENTVPGRSEETAELAEATKSQVGEIGREPRPGTVARGR